jgi:cation transport regulator ChaB
MQVTHIGMGRAKVEKVASNRRILGPNGKVKFGRMSTCKNAAMRAEPEGLIDPYLRTLSFWQGDKPLLCMSYYATHPMCNYGFGGVSSEFAGMARKTREQDLPGVAQIYFTGAAGNIAVGKYNDGSKGNRRKFADRLVTAMRAAWSATKRMPISAGDVEWRIRPVSLPLSKRLEETQLVKRLEDPKGKLSDRLFAARDLGYLRRVKAGRKLNLTCLRIGPAWVLHMPGELCIEYQLAAQKMRPDGTVCMAAYVDVGPGYICPKIAYPQGGYEAGRVSRVSPDAELVLTSAMRDLLK